MNAHNFLSRIHLQFLMQTLFMILRLCPDLIYYLSCQLNPESYNIGMYHNSFLESVSLDYRWDRATIFSPTPARQNLNLARAKPDPAHNDLFLIIIIPSINL